MKATCFIWEMAAFFVFMFLNLLANNGLLAANYTVKPGESINVKLAALLPGDTLFVRTGTYNESLSLPRSGIAGKPIVFAAFPGERPLIESGDTIININKSYWIIDGFVFDHKNADSDAFLISSKASFNSIRNCEIRNGRRDGFDIKGGASDNIIENNVIHDFFKSGTDAHGVVTNPGVVRLKILNNTIYNCSGDCIQLYANNSDPASSYSRNITISGNVLYTMLGSSSENALDFKGVDGCVVSNNDMYGFQDKAMVVQKGCRNITVEGNVIRDSQRGMEFRGEGGKSQKNIFVRKNLIYNIGRYYAVKFDWVDSVQFVNNTLAFVTPAALRVEEEGVTNGTFKNNLFYKCSEPIIKGTFQANFSHNGWYSTSAGDLSGPNDQTGSHPNLLDENNNDFQLASGSPAIDKGTDIGLPYLGSAPDLGAFEFGENPTSVKEPDRGSHGPASEFQLGQNWPNPFSLSEHAKTRFFISSPVRREAEIRIYNVLGQVVQTLRYAPLNIGKNVTTWDGRAASGQKVAPGLYFMEFTMGGIKLVRSFVALR